MPAFAEYLSHHCKAQRLSTSELARRLGVSRSYAHQIQEGLTTPSDRVIELLAQVLDLPLDDLYVAAGKLPPDLRNNVGRVTALYRQFAAFNQNQPVPARQAKPRRKLPEQPDLPDGPAAA